MAKKSTKKEEKKKAKKALAKVEAKKAEKKASKKEDLLNLYSTSSVLVVPSLIEGFGHVYLEALSCGCPVLGTENTGLADIGREENGVFITKAGDIDKLSQKLVSLSSMLTKNKGIRIRARSCAASFPWARFRLSLHRTLKEKGFLD